MENFVNSDWFLSTVQVAPVIGVLAVVIVVLWKEYRSSVDYIRKQDKENLAILNDLSVLLTNVLASNENQTKELNESIKQEASKTRNLVDHRIDLLEQKVGQK